MVSLIMLSVMGSTFLAVGAFILLSNEWKVFHDKEWLLLALYCVLGIILLYFAYRFDLDERPNATTTALIALEQTLRERFNPHERPNATTTMLAAWVQVVPGDDACAPVLGDPSPKAAPPIGGCSPQFSARAVVSGANDCPTIAIKRNTGAITGIRMEKRQGYAGKGLQGVTVCAAPADGDTSQVKFSEKLTISVTEHWSESRPIVLFGDSGCKLAEERDCDSSGWPFETVANQAKTEQPGLVVHLGDYVYRDNDDWNTWKKYFFDPAKSLLEAAPWILVRGNHERCSSEEGQYPRGYHLLFGDGPAMPCNSVLELVKPYAVDLSKQFRLIVADSAAAFAKDPVQTMSSECGTKGSIAIDRVDAKVCAAIMDVLEAVKTLASSAKGSHTSGEEGAAQPQVWLATHVPVFGFERKGIKDDIPIPSAMMLGAWKGAGVKGVDLIVSGDRHVHQVVTTEGEPDQISAGTGGVALDDLPYANGSKANVAKFVTLKTSIAISGTNYDAGKTISRDMVAKIAPMPSFSQEGCSYQGFGFLMVEWQNGYGRPSFKPVSSIPPQQSCP